MKKVQLISKLTEFANTAYVHSRKITHAHGGVWDEYPCANPDGPVDNCDCPEDDDLCNCPCQELKPNSEEQLEIINKELHGEDEEGNAIMRSVSPDDMKEPTQKEVIEAEESIKECELIKSVLGEEYLGCLWKDIKHPSSCNCPCVGEKFGEYLGLTRTYATYWDTEPNQPLIRNAQMTLLTSQRIILQIMPDYTLRPGMCIYIKDPEAVSRKEKKFGGRWLVQSILHQIGGWPVAAAMIVTAVRDTQVQDPNKQGESPID
tara:strand:- start:2116 stop:2898 length:783 start_codon:yes stop_codon:yes gene_type:complete